MPRVRDTRIWTVATASLLLAAGLAPVATAAIEARSVGQIFVDAAGRASGENLAASIAEAEGVLTGFRSEALGTEVFSHVAIDGFAQAEKIQGVGSSSLVLRGSNAVVTLHDNVHSALQVATTRATSVRFHLGPGVHAERDAALPGLVHLKHDSRGYLGSLVATGGNVRVLADEVQVDASGASRILFLGKPAHLAAPAPHVALAQAAAEGALASVFVTAFEGSSVRQSQVDLATGALARTTAGARGVETATQPAPGKATLVAYDLAYETLPARDAGDVAVYVDGQLASRVASAGDVLARAKAGVAAYHALVEGGRAAILATPGASGEHRIAITVNAQAQTESQAQAEGRADDESRVYGSFQYHDNGKLTGEFVSAVLPQGRAEAIGFTALATRTEVFRHVRVDEGAKATFRAEGDHAIVLATSTADLTLVDDLYATVVLAASAPTSATYELGSGVTAQGGGDVVELAGPHGDAGDLILVGPGRLQLEGDALVRATLEPGSRVVYRGAPETFPSDDEVALALADGRLGAQLLAGMQGSAPATDATAYQPDVDTRVTIDASGAIRIEYAPGADAPQSFAFDSRGAALAAKTASDILVQVDGAPALLAASASDLLETSAQARYFAETNAEGSLRVLVNTAAGAGERAVVTIESRVETAARAAARTDAFGAFKLFYDGTAVGSFVTLKADQAAGAISGFTMVADQRPVFASVVAGASAFSSAGADGASVLRLANRESAIEVSDTTSGFTRILALEETDAAFRLAAGLRAESRAASIVEILDADGEHVGSLLVAGAGSIEQRADGQLKAHLAKGASLLFRTHAGIESELSAAQRTMINRAIAAGHIAGQVMVQTEASEAARAEALLERAGRVEGDGPSESVAVAAAEAYGQVTSSVTAQYDGDVQMITAATKDRVEITVASATDVGKTLLISLDRDTVSGVAEGRATIRFDGAPARQASSYADVLDPNDDGGTAEYFVLAGDAGTQVLVSVPHFSVHTVTLEETTDHPNSLYMYATILLGAIVVVEGILLARRRRA